MIEANSRIEVTYVVQSRWSEKHTWRDSEMYEIDREKAIRMSRVFGKAFGFDNWRTIKRTTVVVEEEITQ